MNKLVSKNPILRFKEGKIIKAEEGVKTSKPINETIGHYVREKNRSIFGSGWRWYDTRAPFRSKEALNLEIEQDGWILKSDGTKIRASLRNKLLSNTPSDYSFMKRGTRLRTPEEVLKLKTPEIQKYLQRLQSLGFTAKPTNKVSISVRPLKTQEQWNNEFANNFTNTLTQAQRQYLDSKGVNYTNASDVQKFLMDLLQTDLGGYKNDGKWGKNSILAWKDFAANNIPENFDVTLELKNMNIGTTPYVSTKPVANFGYRTSNTYENNDFSDRLKNMGIRSNADLIDFMYRTNGKNYNWNGDNWARQFRSDVNQALGGDYSDANIRKVFSTSGNWGRGLLGRGDLRDFQTTLQTNAGTWNGSYDRNLGNYVKNIDWSKFKLFKKGGQLVSRNPVEKFKKRSLNFS